MTKLVFASNARPSLGVELEVALVDSQTMALSNSIQDVLDRLPEQYQGSVKPELMQSYLEINTCICRTVAEAEADLREKIIAVEQVTDQLGLQLFWGGTHPFSLWQDQQPTPNDRYHRLLEMLQDIGRQLVTFGMHVHVGLDSGDKAVMMSDRLQRHLPTLLAMSCSSPWWNNRPTGLLSHRAKILESLPTAGLPPLMRNWSEYAWLVNHLINTGFINSIRDIWWDVRPHHNFGTIEVRVCDIPGNLPDCLGLAAIIQCLVVNLSRQIDEGTYQHDHHPMIVRQNKWRAARYGLAAELVNSDTYELQPARDVAENLIVRLQPVADELQCSQFLEHARQVARGTTWAERQLEVYRQSRDPREVVQRMIEYSRLSPAA